MVFERLGLTQEEQDACRDAFLMFDKDRSGSIDLWELKLVLVAMGQSPTEEEVFEIVASVDENHSGSIGGCKRLLFRLKKGGGGWGQIATR